MTAKLAFALSMYALLLLLSACGIEGSGVTVAGSGGVTVAGVVTAKGSIFVNGIELDTRGAVITIDGRAAAEADLAVGQIVVVEGELDDGGTTGSAQRVAVGTIVAGPISAIDLPLNRITILGQTIELDPNTIIEPLIAGKPLGGLALGDDVEINGFADSMGDVSARRIVPRGPNTPLQINGYVSNLDSASKQFTINAQVVRYGAAALVGFGARALENAPVRVTGVGLDASGALEAKEVIYRDPRLPGAQDDAALLQGWITRFAAENDFDVDGHPVVTTSATRIIGQVAFLNGLRLDAFVTVTGDLTADGTVEASEVRLTNLISLDSVINPFDSVDTGAQYVSGYLRQGSCRVTSETGIRIDGVPSDYAALRAGDVATIYEHTEGPTPTTDSLCLAIEVEHHVRGPLESKPGDSLRFTVMGQNVWLVADAHAQLDLIDLGDIVEVSGHLTADGEILASGVHGTNANAGYRVIGLARSVDPLAGSFELGSLTIDYSNAVVSGFAGNAPAEGDRVLVISETAPAAGLLRADAVGYTGGMPRGAVLAQVLPQGLITRLASAGDFDVEGRRFVEPPASISLLDPVPERRCDLDKLHLDMSFESLMTHGNEAGAPPTYFWALCPPGRRIDARGPYLTPNDAHYFDGAGLSGPIEAIDVDRRTLRVAGFDVALNPATLLTRFEGSRETGLGVTTPLTLSELLIGERAQVTIKTLANMPDARPVSMVWLGDAVTLDSEVVISSYIESATEPDLTLSPGLRFTVPPTTTFTMSDCYGSHDVEAADFWYAASWYPDVTVFGITSGSEFVPQHIEWTDYCCQGGC